MEFPQHFSSTQKSAEPTPRHNDDPNVNNPPAETTGDEREPDDAEESPPAEDATVPDYEQNQA